MAAALAELRFDERASGARDELGPVSSALNAAGVNIGQLVGTLRQERTQLDALLNALALAPATDATSNGRREPSERQKEIIERLEKGEITPEEAKKQMKEAGI